MRYGEGDRESDNVEDRRGDGPSSSYRRGPGIPIPLPTGGLGIGSLIFIGVVCLMLGINPLTLLTGQGLEIPHFPRPDERSSEDIPGLPGKPGGDRSNDEMSKFVRRVLADTEDVWDRLFKSAGRRYEPAKLVLFRDDTPTACGTGESAMGPFYCPLDRKVYIDLQFYEDLKNRFNAPGDFAQAYVIAHEIGHHVQNLLGIAEEVQKQKARARSKAEVNGWQVKMELQADCFAGVWASLNDQLRKRLDPGDIEKGLNAAAAIGDDRLQRQAGRRVAPESFTHGSSAQRVKWFKRGLDTGNPQVCNTLSLNIEDL